jgi:hypothetical protein
VAARYGGPAWLLPFGVHYHVAPLAIVSSANKRLFEVNRGRVFVRLPDVTVWV